MIKAAVFLKRKPGMSPEEFQRHWREDHAEVVMGLPGLCGYVQSHALLSGYKRSDLVHDGVAEVWFTDLAAMQALPGTAEYNRVLKDEEAFLDRKSMSMIVVDEKVIKPGKRPENGVKNIEFVHRRPDMPVGAFQRYWQHVHGPLAARIPVLKRYVQSHTRISGYQRKVPPVYDGIAVTWFDSVDAMRVSATTEEYAKTRADEPNFIADEPIRLIITKEEIILPPPAAEESA